MKPVFIIISIYCLLILPALSSEVYSSEDQNLQILYLSETDEYQIKTKNEQFKISRYRFNENSNYIKLLKDLSIDEAHTLQLTLNQHYDLFRIITPSQEELIQEALNMKNLSLGIIKYGQSFPCSTISERSFLTLQGPSRYEILIDSEEQEKIDQIILDEHFRNKGFLPFEKITGLRLEFMSGNDNPLHGTFQALGLSERGEGLEGDDLGKTFSISGEVALEFEDSEISLKREITGYGRLTSRNMNPYQPHLIGTDFSRFQQFDDQGRIYQEFLSVDGLIIEIKKGFGDNDHYFRVVGKTEKFDDQGIAARIQDVWHRTVKDAIEGGVDQYHYMHHYGSDRRNSAELRFGQNFEIARSDKYIVSAYTEGGVRVSNRDSARDISIESGVIVASQNMAGDMPKWEFEIGTEARYNREREHTLVAEVGITRRFYVHPKTHMYITGGMQYDDSPLNRAYSENALRTKNRLDFFNFIGMGLERRY